MRPFDDAAPARAIIGFGRDADGHWVAELACGHRQHVRHEPPMQSRPWVLTADGRASRLDTSLPCMRCLATASTADADDARRGASGEPSGTSGPQRA